MSNKATFGAMNTLWLVVACGGVTEIDSQAQSRGLISQTCTRVTACRSDFSQEECEQGLGVEQRRAIQKGCGTLHDHVMVCDQQHPGVCGLDSRYEISADCSGAMRALEDCTGDGRPTPTGSCGLGSCPNPPCPNICFIECGDFAAQCSGLPGEPMSCSCTTGARAGQSFSASDCASMNSQTAAFCR